MLTDKQKRRVLNSIRHRVENMHDELVNLSEIEERHRDVADVGLDADELRRMTKIIGRMMARVLAI
jgi:GTP1/Obg family GTP-binding protein